MANNQHEKLQFLGPLLMNSASSSYNFRFHLTIKKQAVFPHRTSTHIHAGDSTSMHHSLMFFRIPSVYKQFACEMVRSAEELFAIEKMAAQSMSIKKIAETVWVPLRMTKRVAAYCSKTQRKTRHEKAF